jgi:hypothetical protein
MFSCGIDEINYLPQVSQGDIEQELTNKAIISLPSLTSYSYATGYVIFYKIYIVSTVLNTVQELISNNSRISSDYSNLYSYTDPANASSIPALNTFSSRGFYELELEKSNIRTLLSTSGGTITIQFPLTDGQEPYINNPDNPIYRSNGGGTFTPEPDRYFLSSPILNDYANATSTKNADVSGQDGVSEYAYASMYVVAVGTNQNKGNFSRLYGKPTFINIFKLPNKN